MNDIGFNSWLRLLRALAAPILAIGLLAAGPLPAADMATVPLWNGETLDPAPSGRFLNRFGGGLVTSGIATVSHSTTVDHSGTGAFRIDTNQAIPLNGYDFVATAFTGFFGDNQLYTDARDLSRYSDVLFQVRNDTGSPLTLKLEIKDYRLLNEHRATRAWVLGSEPVWTQLSAPLSLGSPWVVDGSPDLTRARQLAFVIEANQGAPVDGSLYLDDLELREPGGPVDPATAPFQTILERLARRQFDALWGVRDRATGLMPAVSYYADLAGTNVLAALLQMLPGAVDRGWISRAAADAYVTQVVSTLGTVMDGSLYVPPRYLDRVTLQRLPVREESSVDAAFLVLALYQYQTLPETGPALASAIAGLLARFDLASFAVPAGWRLAYRYDAPVGFTTGTYDGYSGEPWLISLAAHLSTAHHVEMAAHYHSAVNRVRAYLVDPSRAHLVHSAPEFRAPFLQWLLPLFVRVDNRGRDTYPDPSLASNPLSNAVLYQREAHARAQALGRATHLQPDAGDDGSGSYYRQFSYYADFGRPDLFMPWSVAFGFLAEPPVAESALRSHLSNGLHGPLGLLDSADWPVASPAPTRLRAGVDFWNLSLSTLALLQYLYGGNERLARQPAVRQALDQVFRGQDFYTVPPCRVVDTRTGAPLASEGVRVEPVAGTCGVPLSARCVSANVTAVGPTGLGYLTLYAGGGRPLASSLNFAAGQTRANNALLLLSPDGAVSVFAAVTGAGQTHLVLDVNGYFE